MRTSHRGSRKRGNHIQLTSVATPSTWAARFRLRPSRCHRLPPAALRTISSASAKPAAKRNAGATSPSIESRNFVVSL